MQPHPAISDFSIKPPGVWLDNIDDAVIPFYGNTAVLLVIAHKPNYRCEAHKVWRHYMSGTIGKGAPNACEQLCENGIKVLP